MELFVFVATAFFAFFFMIWISSSWINVLIKAVLFVMTGYGMLLSAQILGFVVKG